MGAETAPASSATVKDHCTVFSDTCIVLAISGSRGAPRLLTMPAIVVAAIRAPTNATPGGGPGECRAAAGASGTDLVVRRLPSALDPA